jgi:hypothetical protein
MLLLVNAAGTAACRYAAAVPAAAARVVAAAAAAATVKALCAAAALGLDGEYRVLRVRGALRCVGTSKLRAVAGLE